MNAMDTNAPVRELYVGMVDGSAGEGSSEYRFRPSAYV